MGLVSWAWWGFKQNNKKNQRASVCKKRCHNAQTTGLTMFLNNKIIANLNWSLNGVQDLFNVNKQKAVKNETKRSYKTSIILFLTYLLSYYYRNLNI